MPRATPLVDLPRLATRCGVAKVVLKDEGLRPLGSFKALGGVYAGLRALARATGLPDIATLVAARRPRESLPTLDLRERRQPRPRRRGRGGTRGRPARVYLHGGVPPARARRIAARGAEIVRVEGTYDDAVVEAARAAARGEGLLIADTAADEDDPVVADVMAGYGLMAQEIVEQLRAMGDERPTHLFVQAGVGGLAAALAEGVRGQMAGGPPGRRRRARRGGLRRGGAQGRPRCPRARRPQDLGRDALLRRGLGPGGEDPAPSRRDGDHRRRGRRWPMR